MKAKKQKNKAYKKSFAFFVENDGLFDKQMKFFAKEIILTLAQKLDEPKKGEIADLLGLQRNRLTRLLNGLGIEDQLREIANGKKTGRAARSLRQRKK